LTSDPPDSGARSLLQAQYERARQVLPVDVFGYLDGGAGDETARDEAEQAWHGYRLLPSVLRDVADFDSTVTLLGQRLPHAVLVAPTAAHGLIHPDGELATAHGAASAGSLLTVSTRASAELEAIAAAAGPWWLQVYLMRDRDRTAAIVRRATAAGASALVLTGDTPYLGRKARAGRPFAVESASEQDPAATEADIGWLADLSGLPVLVKGVLRPDDARRCLAAGAAGLIVSNHGGRQVSRAVATAQALAGVVDAVDAVGSAAPVLVDGGLRSGADIAVALALGARAVMIGRPVLWGLAADGAAGVHQALAALAEEAAFTANLLGVPAFNQLDRSFLTPISEAGTAPSSAASSAPFPARPPVALP
jgi:4-hydroxymandelate oxidase